MKVLPILVVTVALVQLKLYSKSGEGVRRDLPQDGIYPPLAADPKEVNAGSMFSEWAGVPITTAPEHSEIITPAPPRSGGGTAGSDAPAAEWRDNSRAYEDAKPAGTTSYATPPIASVAPSSESPDPESWTIDEDTLRELFGPEPWRDAKSTTTTNPPTSSDNGVSVASGAAPAAELEEPILCRDMLTLCLPYYCS